MLFETLPVQLHFLPDDVRIEDVVRRTRHAAHVFLTNAARGWTRTKLRSWLIVEYGMATEWTREDEVAPWLHPVARMDDASVEAVVEDARMRKKKTPQQSVARSKKHSLTNTTTTNTTSRIAAKPCAKSA